MKKLLCLLGSKMEDGFIKQLIMRLASKNPAFFKTLQGWAVGIGGVLGAVTVALQTHEVPDFKHENIVLVIVQFLTAFFAGVALTASTPTTDAKLMGGDVKGKALEEASDKGIVTIVRDAAPIGPEP